MKPREYCCCAIPVANAGVYAVLLEQLALSVIVGLLSVAAPSIVGAATPSFAPWILAIVCFVAGGIQVLGIIGAARDKHILFRRFLTFHSLVALAAFGVAVAWIIISASRHSTAKNKCIIDFFTSTNSGANLNSESQVLCDIFPWVDVGIMGALWVIFALIHIYFYVVLNGYSNGQVDDHARYSALGDSMNASSVPLYTRGQTSPENVPYFDEPKEGHYRKESAASLSDVINEPVRQPMDGNSTYNYGYGYQPQQGPGYTGHQATYDRAVSPPRGAYTNDPGPTPMFSNDIYGGFSSLERPAQAQPHPSEGFMGRKTPRAGDYY